MLKFIMGTVVLALLLATEGAAAGDLMVEVRGAASTRGAVLVALFDTPGTFLGTPLLGVTVPATNRPTLALFSNLKPGTYAISAFHDVNGNGKLDTNVLGLPTEKYGFGNDAMGAFGPPTFKAASVTIGPENRSIVINLR